VPILIMFQWSSISYSTGTCTQCALLQYT
jgi:hypothetical protein